MISAIDGMSTKEKTLLKTSKQNMSKEYHIQNRFEYFLNAIHYCIWLYEIKFGESAGRIVDVLFAPIPKSLFSEIAKTDIISDGLIIGLVTFILLILAFSHSY